MAVVSDGRKLLFIHIPKNGGVAVADYLCRHLDDGIRVMEDKVDRAVFPEYIEKHAPASAYRSWAVATGRNWSDYFSFAVIRNPVTRPESVFREIRAVSPALRVSDPVGYWQRVNGDWWERFDALRDVNEFILSGLYDPEGPLSITRTQWWFVSELGTQIVSALFQMRRMSVAVPAALGLPGPIRITHQREYEPTGLRSASVRKLRRDYEVDFDLFDRLEAG